jgi:hypothetical protein
MERKINLSKTGIPLMGLVCIVAMLTIRLMTCFYFGEEEESLFVPTLMIFNITNF